jgi:hypothetical protein
LRHKGHTSCWLAWRRLLGCQFFRQEGGEVAPASYLITLPVALMLIFFAFDLGLRKGARLAVEYAAFCAARAAAVHMPSPTGGCQDAEVMATHAAAVCLASIASKRGAGSLDAPGSLSGLVRSTERLVSVKLSGGCTHNGLITAEVSYQYGLAVPFSPLRQRGGLTMTASAQAMLQTIK